MVKLRNIAEINDLYYKVCDKKPTQELITREDTEKVVIYMKENNISLSEDMVSVFEDMAKDIDVFRPCEVLSPLKRYFI